MSSTGPKIYLLPNLMTAGNLFCGFAAVRSIIEGKVAGTISPESFVGDRYKEAIAFILGACVFDLLDGRLARLGGRESPFGREFDSLADVVSFGVAPALLVYDIVLRDFAKTGWVIAFFYLLCGTLRLARFNCIAADPAHKNASKDFEGFPIPAAAGLIASLTLFMLWLNEGQHALGPWKFGLPAIMIFVSVLMFSHVRYPSFKAVNWRTQRSLPAFLVVIGILAVTALNYQWMPAVLFVAFLVYGFVRPFVSKAFRREIEDDDESEESEEPQKRDAA
ncbi:MAG: CDP-diacylglycerol--serine O-phosphatidyltransferase [Chthoniobacterales bacterium]